MLVTKTVIIQLTNNPFLFLLAMTETKEKGRWTQHHFFCKKVVLGAKPL